MRTCAGLLLGALGLLSLPACGDDPVACGEPANFTADALDLEWKYQGGEVISIPLVADVDDDGIPDVIVNITRSDGLELATGELALLDGVTGELKWRIPHDPSRQQFGAQGRATMAVADVDGDRVPDIIYAGREDAHELSPIHAVDGSGKLLWTSRGADGQTAALSVQQGAPAVANLDADASAEIVFGAAILDHDGLLVWNQDGAGSLYGTPTDNRDPPKFMYRSGLATLVDLDGDDKPEILTGRDAWKIAWTPGAPPSVTLTRMWQDRSGTGNDGWPAVADLDANGTPEVVLVAWPDIKVLDGRTGDRWCGADPTGALCFDSVNAGTGPVAIEGGNLGGPATLADFDGDGRLEAAIAGGSAIAVYDFNRPGEDVVVAPGTPMPAAGSTFVRWSTPIQDNSSAANGSTAFDFDFDGIPELLHQDECSFRVLDGATGEVLGDLKNSSLTGHEYPVVADIDADGHTEILVVANRGEAFTDSACKQQNPEFVARQGVFAYGPGDQLWATARPFWPQYNHHATDLTADGRVPQQQAPHFADPATNGFRRVSAVPDANTCE